MLEIIHGGVTLGTNWTAIEWQAGVASDSGSLERLPPWGASVVLGTVSHAAGQWMLQ